MKSMIVMQMEIVRRATLMMLILYFLKRKVVMTETPKVPRTSMVAPIAIARVSMRPDLRMDSRARFKA